jgi:sporulation protein YlmC with PRC-barrel domain
MPDDIRPDAYDAAVPLNRVDERDIDKTRPDAPAEARIVPLNDVKSEFQVAEGDCDIRGWDVRTSDGHTIGHVNDLIVDTGKMKARYIEVKIDRDVIGTNDDRLVVLPIGEARLDNNEDNVYVNLSASELISLPAYDRSTFNRAYETSLRDRFPHQRSVPGTASTATGSAGGIEESLTDLAASNRVPDATNDAFYDGDAYDERRLFGARRAGRETSYIGRTPRRRDDQEVQRSIAREDERELERERRDLNRNAPNLDDRL